MFFPEVQKHEKRTFMYANILFGSKFRVEMRRSLSTKDREMLKRAGELWVKGREKKAHRIVLFFHITSYLVLSFTTRIKFEFYGY